MYKITSGWNDSITEISKRKRQPIWLPHPCKTHTA
nr:MAG TPA: hypothetical protein [Caudoviricetes sp.]